jgi:predicted TIM-barrel fold metal-dependent hydrolase
LGELFIQFRAASRRHEFDDACWVYGSDIPYGDRLYGAVDVFLKRDDISEESKRKLLVDNTASVYGPKVGNAIV